jgi:transcriptional regulator NrdR family protein
MNCPICDSKTNVVETRSPIRLRECKEGHRFKTLEGVQSILERGATKTSPVSRQKLTKSFAPCALTSVWR